jgi:hypothetical protein
VNSSLKIWRHVSEYDSYFSVMGGQNYFFYEFARQEIDIVVKSTMFQLVRYKIQGKNGISVKPNRLLFI